MSELNDCIIVLRADARANDVEVGLRHEIKHLYFSSLFPNSDKLSFLDRAKDEIIAYLSEYRDVYGNPEDLSNAVFQAIQGYFDDILE